ncbi:uncharacterized protein CIMG_09096 [Coccidioides immitis RS]|uniref:Uncharacterized protein n=2 Tax=Coccidioides immitis TaxID=5501 RepID=A0A0J8RRS3_COCIT|nr:uncharacterized protein CIMG_09096 [Coccidioides immitis RS]EAS27892.3 hypothetical protein CIMG_09096 [Coccidioides immitis RS]KMP08686.1 hypothetical protein CIRG_08367 [Coccidioides immitis RMSCC 2394]KMU87497.1 hypothetical protein CIHG_05293 [Coccidioides immitis H538.4]TPX20573.1 hypothetical protein DIZ76_016465 [Coccidioides immitis]
MLLSRYTLFWALSAALSGYASAAGEVLRRQDSVELSATTELPSTTATADASVSAFTSEAVETSTATVPAPTQDASPPEPTDSDVEACHADEGSPGYPFCEPRVGQELYVDDVPHPVTWDVDAFGINSTVIITLEFVNVSESESKLAYTSEPRPNKIGFVDIKMDKSWLRDKPRNNLTLHLINFVANNEEHRNVKIGPTFSLTKKPVQHYPPPPPSKPNKLGLMVGLPVALVVVFFIACGLCIGMRKHRRIGLGSIMGRRSKGYGGAKSRIERLGGRGRRRDRSVRLDDLEDVDRYTDDPQGRADMDRFNDMERNQGNAFKTDLARMKTWR